MTLEQIRAVLHQATELGTVETVYLRGRAVPVLPHPAAGAVEAAALGFKRGIVSNAYWATSVEDAMHWLRPIAEIGIADLSLSSDLYHGEAMMTGAARNGVEAAQRLGLPEGIITVEPPAGCSADARTDKGEPITGGPVRFRGRAVATLSDGAPRRPWTEFTACPDEDFADPGRVHVDAFGHLHVCQGLSIGNLWRRPLVEIVASYEPGAHPIIGPLLEGGPVALVERHNLPHAEAYIDACHLCYLA
jgi:hypothetical protein